jgi:uncharacterized protein Yka (UPF0111/DUF47 family)
MEFSHFIEWAFYGLISATAVYIASTIGKMKQSIEELNVTFAREIEKLSSVKNAIEKHERHLDKLDDRVLAMELKCSGCSR